MTTEIISAGMCVQCSDQPSEVSCLECADDYCKVCWHSLHTRGNRAKHQTRELANANKTLSYEEAQQHSSITAIKQAKASTAAKDGEDATLLNYAASLSSLNQTTPREVIASDVDMADATTPTDRDAMEAEDGEGGEEKVMERSHACSHMELEETPEGKTLLNRCKTIPLRLDEDERRLLKLLEQALNVSEYTDKIDIVSFRGKGNTILTELEEVFSILTGLSMASEYTEGKKLLARDFKKNRVFFQRIFEIGRRHKIRNPEKMRTSYGKLLHLLQDSVDPEVRRGLGFDLVTDIQTCALLLEKTGMKHMMHDPGVITAVEEIDPLLVGEELQLAKKNKQLGWSAFFLLSQPPIIVVTSF